MKMICSYFAVMHTLSENDKLLKLLEGVCTFFSGLFISACPDIGVQHTLKTLPI